MFWTTEHFVTKLGMVMQHREPECHAEKTYLLSSRSGSRRGLIWSKCDFSTISSELQIFRQPNLVWWYIIISQSILLKTLDYCFEGQGYSEGSECRRLSRYLLNRQIFFNQFLYCDATSWAGMSCKKIGLLFSRSGSQQRLISSNYDIFTVSSVLLILLPPNLVW